MAARCRAACASLRGSAAGEYSQQAPGSSRQSRFRRVLAPATRFVIASRGTNKQKCFLRCFAFFIHDHFVLCAVVSVAAGRRSRAPGVFRFRWRAVPSFITVLLPQHRATGCSLTSTSSELVAHFSLVFVSLSRARSSVRMRVAGSSRNSRGAVIERCAATAPLTGFHCW